MAPRLTFSFKDGQVPAERPVILGMIVCADCRPGLMQRASVKDAAERILESLLDERPKVRGKRGGSTVDMTIDWIPLTHPDYLKHKGLGPS